MSQSFRLPGGMLLVLPLAAAVARAGEDGTERGVFELGEVMVAAKEEAVSLATTVTEPGSTPGTGSTAGTSRDGRATGSTARWTGACPSA